MAREPMTCADPRCDGGVVVTGPYLASDGSADWHETPCGLCSSSSLSQMPDEDENIPF